MDLVDYNSFLEIVANLSVADLVSFASTQKQYNTYTKKKTFWSDYIRLRYGWILSNATMEDTLLLEHEILGVSPDDNSYLVDYAREISLPFAVDYIIQHLREVERRSSDIEYYMTRIGPQSSATNQGIAVTSTLPSIHRAKTREGWLYQEYLINEEAITGLLDRLEDGEWLAIYYSNLEDKLQDPEGTQFGYLSVQNYVDEILFNELVKGVKFYAFDPCLTEQGDKIVHECLQAMNGCIFLTSKEEGC